MLLFNHITLFDISSIISVGTHRNEIDFHKLMSSEYDEIVIKSMTSTSALMILGEYLNHISFIKDKIPMNIREEARIGADVIAASSQYSIAAVESINEEDSPSLSLPVFALIRSAIYGLLYLDNVDLVRRKEKLPSPGRFIQITMNKWNEGNTFGLGLFDEDTDYHELWGKLSEFVHIIPAINKGGGAKYSEVAFDFRRDLSEPTKHAGLPDEFDKLAIECLEWHALLVFATMKKFRESHTKLFNFNSAKVQSHLENTVFPDCITSLTHIFSSLKLHKSARNFPKEIFK